MIHGKRAGSRMFRTCRSMMLEAGTVFKTTSSRTVLAGRDSSALVTPFRAATWPCRTS